MATNHEVASSNLAGQANPLRLSRYVPRRLFVCLSWPLPSARKALPNFGCFLTITKLEDNNQSIAESPLAVLVIEFEVHFDLADRTRPIFR